MTTIESITDGQALVGIEPSGVVAVVIAVVPIAKGTVQIIYNTPGGVRNRADELTICLATSERPWSF